MKIYNNISELTGNTPMVRLNRINHTGAVIMAKLEFFTPTSSVKDRIAVNMINRAEADGALQPGGTIIEPTSGNTGLGLAMVAAARGYRLIITMPDTMSVERRRLMEQLGAEVVLTDGASGMRGAIDKASELAQEIPGSFMPQQFSNPANPEAHEQSTAEEIWQDTDGKVDVLIAGVGTGGTITGTGHKLKEYNRNIKIIAVEPQSSAVLSGADAGKHAIQGIGAGFIPEVLDRSLLDEIITVSDCEALEAARNLAASEGILCGISSGAAVAAALKFSATPAGNGRNIVVILPDTGERYLSTALFQTA
jgi:cysteine synthase A